MPLSQFKGKVVLLVNTASECGYTGQYEGLEQVWLANKDKGLVVVGVPSNDFGAQEPGTAGEIASFCKLNYGVTFPLTDKLVVKGAAAHPLYQWATAKAGNAGRPKWNFHKFLFGRDGEFIDWFIAGHAHGAKNNGRGEKRAGGRVRSPHSGLRRNDEVILAE